jgi:succinate dehydrogenase hydrophobic anchor subunit
MNIIAGLSGLLDLTAVQKVGGIVLVICSAWAVYLWITQPEVFR